MSKKRRKQKWFNAPWMKRLKKYIIERLLTAIIFFLVSWGIGFIFGDYRGEAARQQLKKEITNLEWGIDYFRNP